MSVADAAEDFKASGNAAFSAGQYSQAVDYFTKAIGLDSKNHVYFSNRSAAHASLGQFRQALADAQSVLALKPEWPKGYSRLGAAHFGLRQWNEAIEAYSKGLRLDPSNQQLKRGLADVQAARGGAARAQPQPAARTGTSAPRVPGGIVQLLLLIAYSVVIVSAVVSMQPFNRALSWAAYFLCCRTTLGLSAFKVYLRFGLPPLRPFPAAIKAWARPVMSSVELWHVIMSTAMMQAPSAWMGVVPLALQAALHLLPALGARFPAHPLWQRYGSRAANLLDTKKDYVLQFVATAEIAMGVQLVLAIFQRGLQAAMTAFVYWSHLRLRSLAPESRLYHQQTWAAIDSRVQPVLVMVPALRRYVDTAKRWFNSPAQHQQ